MGKRLAAGDQAGSSAAAEGRQAARTSRRRELVNAVLVPVAAALAIAATVRGSLWLAVSSGATATLWWAIRPDPDPGRWLRGAEGERATAQILAWLPKRYVVLHDRRRPGSGGNIDHLVIGPHGVWVIDSKARRARLRIHGGQVWAGEHVIDPGPVARQADSIRQLLGEPVGAIVAIHGHGLRRRGKRVDGVRIIPARSLPRRLKRGRRLPHPDRVALARHVERLLPPCD